MIAAMTYDEARAALRQMLLDRSVRRGEFKLVSGATSSVYVDGKLTTLHSPAMPLIGRCLLTLMDRRGWRPQAVGGLSIGADPIVVAVARESLAWSFQCDAYLVRKEAKKHGTQKHIEGIQEPRGMNAVVIDDVCSTGGSTAIAIEKTLEAGMHVLGAVCLVDREMGAPENLRKQFGVELDSLFRLSDLVSDSRTS